LWSILFFDLFLLSNSVRFGVEDSECARGAEMVEQSVPSRDNSKAAERCRSPKRGYHRNDTGARLRLGSAAVLRRFCHGVRSQAAQIALERKRMPAHVAATRRFEVEDFVKHIPRRVPNFLGFVPVRLDLVHPHEAHKGVPIDASLLSVSL
jgi:hypothetical protein